MKTHLSITVTANNPIARMEVFNHLTRVAVDMVTSFPDVVVTSHEFDEDILPEGEEYFDERTILKVRKILSDTYSGLIAEDIDNIINDFLNAGILFRERRQ